MSKERTQVLPIHFKYTEFSKPASEENSSEGTRHVTSIWTGRPSQYDGCEIDSD